MTAFAIICFWFFAASLASGYWLLPLNCRFVAVALAVTRGRAAHAGVSAGKHEYDKGVSMNVAGPTHTKVQDKSEGRTDTIPVTGYWLLITESITMVHMSITEGPEVISSVTGYPAGY